MKHNKKQEKSQLTLAQAPQVYIYKADALELVTTVANEDIWLSQKQMAELFGVEAHTISYHVKKVYEENKLDDSTNQEIRLVTEDGKSRSITHYNLDVIIPVGYRVGSPEASAFRKWANNVLKQFILVGVAINEKKMGSKSLLKMERDLALFEKYNLTERPEIQRLSRLYDNKLGSELLFAIISDICLDPSYGRIKGAEYKALFGMYADDLKALLGSDKIRESLPDVQLQAFTLAELSLRKILSTQANMSNDQILEAVKISFAPIGAYLKGISDLTGTHHVTGQPLLSKRSS